MSKLDAYEAEIRGFAAQGQSQRFIADKYGVSRDTVQRFLKGNGIEIAGEPVNAFVGDPTREELLAAEVKDLRKAARTVRGIDVANARVVEAIEEALGEGAPVQFEPAPKILEHRGHEQVLLLSDLHGGEVVDPEAMDGINQYNWAICQERMESVFHSVLSYKDTRSYEIDVLQIWMLGDMCSGANHQEIAETNEFPQAVQARVVGELLARFIERLVPHYPRIVVYGVSGNHPRTTKAPAAKQVFDNWDWMSYIFVEVFLRQYIEAGSVECHFPQSGFLVAEVAGLNFLLWHGDGVRSTMVGFPGGGVLRRVRELKAQWAQKGTLIHGVALGHFHSAHVLPGHVYVNGSVKGPDEWCLKQYGYGDVPEQLLLTFDPRKHRRTDVSSINP